MGAPHGFTKASKRSRQRSGFGRVVLAPVCSPDFDFYFFATKRPGVKPKWSFGSPHREHMECMATSVQPRRKVCVNRGRTASANVTEKGGLFSARL